MLQPTSWPKSGGVPWTPPPPPWIRPWSASLFLYRPISMCLYILIFSKLNKIIHKYTLWWWCIPFICTMHIECFMFNRLYIEAIILAIYIVINEPGITHIMFGLLEFHKWQVYAWVPIRFVTAALRTFLHYTKREKKVVRPLDLYCTTSLGECPTTLYLVIRGAFVWIKRHHN